MSNEITVQNGTQVANNIGDFFGDIDFSKLNQTITKLASHNLSDTEKTSAIEIIDSWNENVVQRINVEVRKIDNFINCVQPSASCRGISALIYDGDYSTELEFIMNKIGMMDTYEELIDAIDDYDIANQNMKNVQTVVVDVDTTAADEVMQSKDIEIERIKKSAAVRKAGNRIAKLNEKISNAINSDKDLLKAIRALKKKSNAMRKASIECTDKANLAKINVTIDDASTRDALSELINFTL